MIGYKKSLISLVTALALSSSAIAATSNYVPLATDDADFAWKLFGVDGLFGGGTTSFTTGADWDATLIDSTIDEVASTSMLGLAGTMMELKGLTGTGFDVTSVTLNVDTSPLVWSDTDPMRTMFIAAINTSTVANVMVSYKASMEGQTIQIQIDGDTTTTHQFDLDGSNTYDNPQASVVKSSGGGSTILSDVTDLVDFDFSNNPKTSTLYEKTLHQNTPTGSRAVRLYDYNASDSSWSIYDTMNDTAANDFDSLSEGKAYWGRMDTDGSADNVNGDDVSAGVVLGTGGLESTDYSDLTAGWNLLSFSSTKPTIRSAPTGMILTPIAAGDNLITIIDSTGANSIDVAITAVEADDCIAINMAVEQAQERGEFSDTFDLRAFPVSGTQIALISNKKFTVTEAVADNLTSGTTTIAGGFVWDEDTGALVDYSGATQVPTTGVTSVTGEYMLLVEPLLGADTAAELDDDAEAGGGAGGTLRSAAVQINDVDMTDATGTPVYLAVDDATTTGAGTAEAIADFITALQAESTAHDDGNGVGNAVNIDIDFDGTAGALGDNDWILLASDVPFYVRDHTFTRVVTQHDETATATGETLTFTGATSDETIVTNAAVATTLNNFEVAAETSGVYPHLTSDADGEHFTLVSAGDSTQEYNIFDDDSVEIIEDKLNLTSDVTKGAIKAVASVSSIASTSVVMHSLSIDITSADVDQIPSADGTDTVYVGINQAATAVDIATIPQVLAATPATVLVMFDEIVTELQDRVDIANIDARIYHDYDTATDDLAGSKVYIEGYGVETAQIVFGTAGTFGGVPTTQDSVEANALFGTLSATVGDLETDLRYNAVYTPDFATDGPLYTMKTLGYTIEALVTGSTDMSTGDIAWNSVDLTKTPTEMFDNQDFDLYSIDARAGYWVYLQENANATTLTSATNELNVTITGSNNHTYVHHFNADGTTENHVSANINVLVDGLETDTTPAIVYANAGGTKIHLTSSADDGEYSGNLTSYEVENIRTSSGVTVTASNGYGWKTSAITVKTIDVTKPGYPIVNTSGANGLSITPDSNDTSSMYVFSDNIPESVLASDSAVQAHANFIARMDANASSLSFCANDAITFGNTVTLKILAIDGDGYFGQGNVSDLTTFDFAPATKGSVVLSHAGDGSSANELGIPYDTNCSAEAVDTADRGVSVKSVTSNVTAKVAFESVDNAAFSLDVPFTIYVKDDRDNIAEIKFIPAYGTTVGYVLFDDAGVTRMYEFTFPTDDVLYGNSTLANTADLDGGDLGGAEVTGQSF